MNNTLQIIVFLCYLITCFAAVHYLPNATHPDYPGYCYYEGPPVVKLEIGETARDEVAECGKVSCGDDYTLDWASCGVVSGPDYCITYSDLSLDYPDCCPKLNCDHINMV